MVRLWHVRTGQLTRRVKAHTSVVFDVAFTPDGEGLMSGGMDRILKYWDFSSRIPTFFGAKSQMNDLQRCVAALEERTLPEREYSGHDVRLFYSPSSDSL
jgi:WD40 repeat protein